MSDKPVSHGRGGAANISKDATEYTSGDIVREGAAGDQGDGPFSTGRGGAANIGAMGSKPTDGGPHDKDVIPPEAMRDVRPDEAHHTGRGGDGNVERGTQPSELPAKKGKRASLLDKLKGIFKKN